MQRPRSAVLIGRARERRLLRKRLQPETMPPGGTGEQTIWAPVQWLYRCWRER